MLARVGIDGTTAAASPTLIVMDAYGIDADIAESADRATETLLERLKSHHRYK